MKTRVALCVMCGLCALVSANVSAQQDREREEREQQREENIPTRQDSPEKAIETIVGTWEPLEASGGQVQSTGGDPIEHHTLVFNRENQYLILDGQQQLDSGSWRMNEAHSVIYMESTEGDIPRAYHVSFTGNRLTLQPGPSAAARQDRPRHVFRRSEQ